MYAYARMTTRLRTNSTWATISPVVGSKAGVVEVRITGPLTLQAFNDLRPQVFRATKDATAVVIRLDTALGVMFDPPSIDTSVYRPHAPPQAVVVEEGQYLLWLEMAERLRAIGVKRAIFPGQHLDLALQWAEMAAQHGSELPKSDSVGSGPAPLS